MRRKCSSCGADIDFDVDEDEPTPICPYCGYKPALHEIWAAYDAEITGERLEWIMHMTDEEFEEYLKSKHAE